MPAPRISAELLIMANAEASYAAAEFAHCLLSGGVPDGFPLARGGTAVHLLDALEIAVRSIDGANQHRLDEIKTKLLHVFNVVCNIPAPAPTPPPLSPVGGAA